MSQLISRRHIFPFFQLPRELRSLIYGYSLVDKKLTRYQYLARRVTTVAPQHIMTVSHQFNREVTEQVRMLAHLYVAEVSGVDRPALRANIITQQANIRTLTVVSELNDREDSLEKNRAWMKEATSHMPNLKELNIYLGIYCGSSKYNHIEWRSKIDNADFTSLHHLKTLEIYERGSCRPAARRGKLPWRCMILAWNPATGKIEDTDQVRRKLLEIVGDFWYDDRFVLFQDLDNTGYENYHEVVGHSMDFDMLRYMMRDGHYCNVEDFIGAVLQIVRNVKKFGPLAKLYSKEADELEAELWKKIHQ